MDKFFLFLTAGIILLGILLVLCITNPVMSQKTGNINSDSSLKSNLYRHVKELTSSEHARNAYNPEALNKVADYIMQEFKNLGLHPYEQKYIVDENEFKNIVCTLGPKDKPLIVIGAHYDVCGDQPGADDNASGVAGILELARLLSKDTTLKYKIEFVAYTLEEPPYFRTQNMGSAVHAHSLKENNIEVRAMICLEMIGYFSEEKGSQSYPTALLKPFYPSKGNFILIVGQFGETKLVRTFKKGMRNNSRIDVRSINSPKFVTGVDFSDHLNYWAVGYPAIMITNTSFYRNRNYHEASDTIETLNFDKMSEVVAGIYGAVKNLK
ncbi:MAG: M28 family peptidase [Cytophagaceae bacterium]